MRAVHLRPLAKDHDAPSWFCRSMFVGCTRQFISIALTVTRCISASESKHVSKPLTAGSLVVFAVAHFLPATARSISNIFCCGRRPAVGTGGSMFKFNLLWHFGHDH